MLSLFAEQVRKLPFIVTPSLRRPRRYLCFPSKYTCIAAPPIESKIERLAERFQIRQSKTHLPTKSLKYHHSHKKTDWRRPLAAGRASPSCLGLSAVLLPLTFASAPIFDCSPSCARLAALRMLRRCWSCCCRHGGRARFCGGRDAEKKTGSLAGAGHSRLLVVEGQQV